VSLTLTSNVKTYPLRTLPNHRMNLTGIPLRSIPAGYPQRSAPAAQRKKLQENLSSQGVEFPYKIIPPVEKPRS
jgi:hypothetical protein